MYRDHGTRESLLAALGTLPLLAAPGERVTYSSQGFMLLGLIAEQAGGQGLDTLVAELVCAPLGLRDTGFAPGAADRERAVATERCAWRGRTVAGEVHDENAAVLGGVAGHAGLFATLADMERLAVSLAGGARELLRPETYALMTAPHTDGLNLRRTLAWQGQDPADSPSARPSAPPRTATPASPGRASGSIPARAATRCCSPTGSIRRGRATASSPSAGSSTPCRSRPGGRPVTGSTRAPGSAPRRVWAPELALDRHVPA